MTLFKTSWFICFYTENGTLKKLIKLTYPNNSFTVFTPICHNAESHMFKIIILKKYPFQIIDNKINGTVRGVPKLFVISTSRRLDAAFNVGP